MKVTATKLGFYGGRRRYRGDVFDVPVGATSKWFTPIAAVAEAAAQPVRSSRKKAKE